MPSYDIIFAFPTKAHFSWIEGCKGVDKSDLKALTAVCGYALASLQNELSNQQDSTALKDYNKLQQSAERIRREGLNFDEKKQLNKSAGPIAAVKQGLKLHPKSRDGWQEDAYHELLWLVSTFISPAHALLFLCVISKNRAKNLTAEGRAKLVQYMKRNKIRSCVPYFRAKRLNLGFAMMFKAFLRHQQLQEKHHNGRASSPTQQCIPTPTSNASPSGQDLNLFCHFFDAVDPGLKERKQHRRSPTPISLERLKTNNTHARVEAAEATPSNGLEAMLSRAISPQPRWSEQGVFYEVTPHDAGLHRTLATKISGDQPPEQLQVALAHQKSTLLRKGFVSDRSTVSHSQSPP